MRHVFPALFPALFPAQVLILALILTLGVLSPLTPALAQPVHEEPVHEEKKSFDPERMLEDATREVMRTLEMLLRAIPQYEAPEVLENGDIIIRRIHPKPEKQRPAPDDGTDQTRT